MNQRWRARTRADEIREQAKHHLAALGFPPDPAAEWRPTERGAQLREKCPLCGPLGARAVFVDELLDVSSIEEFPVDYVCGACREKAERDGVISSAELARRLGAPPEVVEKLKEKYRAVRPDPATGPAGTRSPRTPGST